MGSVRRRGRHWSIRYYDVNGVQVEETVKSERKGDALHVLKLREGALARGEPVTAKVGKVTFTEAVKDVVNHYTTNGLKSLPDVERRITKHLVPYFGRRRLASITTADVRAYQKRRKLEGAAAGSINREIALVRRAFRLCQQAGKIHYRPHTPMLKEAPPRQGFLEHDQYQAIVAALPKELRGILVLGYWSGWRRSEIARLQWRQVDRDARLIRLEVGTTKGGEGRTLPYGLVPELVDAMDRQWREHERLRREGTICPWVFFRRKGAPVKSFRRAWLSATKAAGVPGALFHDLRRTAARNLIRAGVNEKLAMEILGHRTPAIFRRYNITTEDDKRDALGKVASCRSPTRAGQGQTEGSADVAGNGAGA